MVLVGMSCVGVVDISFYLSIIYHYSTVVLFILFRLLLLFCDCLYVYVRCRRC